MQAKRISATFILMVSREEARIRQILSASSASRWWGTTPHSLFISSQDCPGKQDPLTSRSYCWRPTRVSFIKALIVLQSSYQASSWKKEWRLCGNSQKDRITWNSVAEKTKWSDLRDRLNNVHEHRARFFFFVIFCRPLTKIKQDFWWLVEVNYWFKVSIWRKFLRIFRMRGKMEIRNVRSNWKFGNSEKLKIPVLVEDTFGHHLWSVIIAITKNHKNSPPLLYY